MTKLSDTQAVILSAASQRDDGAVLPLPDTLKFKGGAVSKVLDSLKTKGLIDHQGAPRGDDPPPLRITRAGLQALGVETEDHASEGATAADTGATSADAGVQATDAAAPATEGDRAATQAKKGKPAKAKAKPAKSASADAPTPRADHLAGRNLALDRVEEADELLVAVALHAVADHGALEHVQRGEQRGRAVPLVVVRHGAEPARLHRQARLGAVERLDLRLRVERQDDRMLGRRDVQADHVLDLGGERRIGGQLEASHPMRRQAGRLPDLMGLGRRHAARPRHRAHGPMRRLAGGGSSRVRRITSATLASGSGGTRDGRVLSRSSPSTPASI